MTKLLEIQNSNYPYLFSHNNEIKLIYTYTESYLTRAFGSSSYSYKPYRLYLTNIADYNPIRINTPLFSETYGNILWEFNPQIIQNDNTISLIYNAACSMGDDGPIIYNLCSIDSEDYTFSNLSNFKILSMGYTGTVPENTNINNSISDIVELLYMTKIFNNSNYLIGCRKAEGYSTYLFDMATGNATKVKDSYASVYQEYVAYTTGADILLDTAATSITIERE